MSELDLDAIKTYTDAATGPRLLFGHKAWAPEKAVMTEEGRTVAVCGHGEQAKKDAEFFARARADMPKLLAEVEQLRAKVARHHEELRDKRTDLLNIRGILKPAPGVGDPVVPMPLGHEVAPAVEWLADEGERLRKWRAAADDAASIQAARAVRAETEVKQLHNLQAVIDRLQEWTTSDVVTARNSFGDGYREAMRDIRDILNGLNGGTR